jgi:hypothetical protein
MPRRETKRLRRNGPSLRHAGNLFRRLSADALAADARLVDATTIQARARRARPRHADGHAAMHLADVVSVMFVAGGAGIGRAGKREQRSNSNGSNFHDRFLHIELLSEENE